MSNFNKKSVLTALQNILDPKRVITDKDILEQYARDETPGLVGRPDMLVRADSARDVSEILKVCNRHRVPVTPRGAGTGVTGGAVPMEGGLVLSLERLNRIVEIDTRNLTAVVEPGAVTRHIQEAVLDLGLMYPPDPASLDNCSIGGNVAEGAGGPRALKYGTTKDYVLGLEFVLPDGSIIQSGGKMVKNATGYNLNAILLGSEGTLAVITKIFLRLIPAPLITRDLLIPFDSMDAAVDAVSAILACRIVPATLEFMEQDAISLVAKHGHANIPCGKAGAHLLIQLDGNTDQEVFDAMTKISETVAVDPESIFVAESGLQKERLWKARRSIRESIKAESPQFFAEDCIVPRSKIAVFLKDLKKYFKKLNLRSVMFGHAGDGNVHIDILKSEMADETWLQTIPQMKREIYRRAISLGGTITAEHGVGYIRKDYMDMVLSDAEIELSKRIKAAFDPRMILNPAKMF